MTLGFDIFENPYGAPDPWSPKTPQQQKRKFQKKTKTTIIPKSKRSFPKSKRSFPKVNVKYFKGILEEFKVFEISYWGVAVTGVSKISNFR